MFVTKEGLTQVSAFLFDPTLRSKKNGVHGVVLFLLMGSIMFGTFHLRNLSLGVRGVDYGGFAVGLFFTAVFVYGLGVKVIGAKGQGMYSKNRMNEQLSDEYKSKVYAEAVADYGKDIRMFAGVSVLCFAVIHLILVAINDGASILPYINAENFSEVAAKAASEPPFVSSLGVAATFGLASLVSSLLFLLRDKEQALVYRNRVAQTLADAEQKQDYAFRGRFPSDLSDSSEIQLERTGDDLFHLKHKLDDLPSMYGVEDGFVITKNQDCVEEAKDFDQAGLHPALKFPFRRIDSVFIDEVNDFRVILRISTYKNKVQMETEEDRNRIGTLPVKGEKVRIELSLYDTGALKEALEAHSIPVYGKAKDQFKKEEELWQA